MQYMHLRFASKISKMLSKALTFDSIVLESMRGHGGQQDDPRETQDLDHSSDILSNTERLPLFENMHFFLLHYFIGVPCQDKFFSTEMLSEKRTSKLRQKEGIVIKILHQNVCLFL